MCDSFSDCISIKIIIKQKYSRVSANIKATDSEVANVKWDTFGFFLPSPSPAAGVLHLQHGAQPAAHDARGQLPVLERLRGQLPVRVPGREGLHELLLLLRGVQRGRLEERSGPRQHSGVGFLLPGLFPHLFLAFQHSLLGQLPLPLVCRRRAPAGPVSAPSYIFFFFFFNNLRWIHKCGNLEELYFCPDCRCGRFCFRRRDPSRSWLFFRGGWQQTATGDTVELVEFCFMGFFFVCEAPIVPSLERVRHKETQFQSSLHRLFNFYPWRGRTRS